MEWIDKISFGVLSMTASKQYILSKQHRITSQTIFWWIIAGLAAWLGIVLSLAGAGAFVRHPGALPFPIGIAVTAPIALALIAFRASGGFREFLMTIDLPLITILQSWRFAGFVFIALHAYDILPGIFAWPAGVGDMAIAATAPWIALAIMRKPEFLTGRLFTLWNALGILDLVVAVGTGTLSAALGLYSEVGATASPMAQLPLVLIPAFLVPIFIMLHLVAMYQARPARRRQSAGKLAIVGTAAA